MQLSNINIFLLSVFLFTTFAHGTVVQTCKKGGIPHYVNITNCEREPCRFPNGKEAEMFIAFTVPKYSAKMKPVATAIIPPGLPLDYPLPDEGCSSILNGYCPVYEGEVLLYRFTMMIDGFPAVSLTLQFELKSDDNETITCFRVKMAVYNESN